MIPQTFEQWKDCLINGCKIELTKEFAKERLAIYLNPNNAETKKFVSVYGEQHLQRIIYWFKQV